ncbi:hypothetical protein J6590_101645 [Homalodisca vitripennis]|nr:hypothetical protein J6590_101645 [Homalodisca vitripennis]
MSFLTKRTIDGSSGQPNSINRNSDLGSTLQYAVSSAATTSSSSGRTLQPTLTVEHAASTDSFIENSSSTAFLYQQTCSEYVSKVYCSLCHIFQTIHVTDENGPTIAFRVTEPNSVSAQSEEIRTKLVTDCEKPDQSLGLRNSESVKQESACYLPTPVTQTSAPLFTPKWKAPHQLTLTVNHAANTDSFIENSSSTAFLYQQTCSEYVRKVYCSLCHISKTIHVNPESGSVLECIALHQQQLTDENGPTIAFRVPEPNRVSAQSEEIRTELESTCYLPTPVTQITAPLLLQIESACCLSTPETQTSAPLYTPQSLGTLPCPRYTVPTTSSSSRRHLASSH